MKLTTHVLNDLLNALISLNGQPKAITIEGHTAVILEPFTFSAVMRAKIARNIARLSRLQADYLKARDSVVAQLNHGVEEKKADRFQQIRQTDEVLLLEEHDITLEELTEKDLQLERNAIQPMSLAHMVPIVTEWREALAPPPPDELEEAA
jgi:hypothetical protein